jgi:membrane associated rhomboid family serine protease
MADGSWQPGAADGALWQVLTTAFTHVEILHIGANMLSLYFLGPLLERMIGRTRFLAVYFLSALAGSVTVMWFSGPLTTTLGASGAIFGLIGALVVVARKSGGDIRNLMFWLLLNLAITFYPGAGISWQGHVGGLVAGLVSAAIVVFAPRANRSQTQVLGLVALLAVLCGLLAFRILQLA